MKKQIESIGIIGGGSAGYLSALYLKQRFPEKTITIIESSKIPVIGVGEATTPLMLRLLHKTLGYSVQEFFKFTKPTIKLGVKFIWGKEGDYHYNNPFGTGDMYNAMHHTGNFNNLSIVSLLMEKNKAPFIKENGKITPLKLEKGYAYHIDNRLFLAYLKNKVLASGCTFIDTEIMEAVSVSGEIDYLGASNGKKYKFDLFIDCSGFQSILLGKKLSSTWIDYSDALLTNRAIIGMRDHNGDIQTYTTAKTLNHGWLWSTPTQQEDHLGYVFSKNHCSDDEAFHELKLHCKTINNEKIINFKTGRYANSWKENVVGIGNAFAFIEPLESTGIHMIIKQLEELKNVLTSKALTRDKINQYNDRVNAVWDNLKLFIGLHFKYNYKLQTPFWKDCQEKINLSEIDDYIDYFMANGPIIYDKEHPIYAKTNQDKIFSAASFDINLTGCGINSSFFTQKSSHYNASWPRFHQLQKSIVDMAISHQDGLKYLEDEPTDFIPAWFKKNV